MNAPMDIPAHPAAAEFPMLGADRLSALADDILANGLREAIRTFDGMVLDGRNRLAACRMAGVAPRFEAMPSDIDPWAYVWSLNGERRDVTDDQRYLIWKSCSEHSDAWQAERQSLADEANRKRAEAANERERNADGTLTASTASARTTSAPTGSQPKKPKVDNRNAKAKASRTNRGAVARMDNLSNKRPDLAEKVKAGDLPAAAAIREMKRAEIVEKLEDTAAKEAKAVQGLYDVIVMDPPWPMEKIERDERPNQSGLDYPTMSEAKIAALTLPSADDCHVWVWTTQKFLPMALRLIDGWGLRYVCTFVWHKPGGFQPVGLPQYNAEFAIYARRGSPKFIDTKAFPVCFEASRGKHSEKPQEFYDVVARVTAGRRLDMFNRRPIPGFDGWGNEAHA